MHHYRNYRLYIPKNHSERVSNKVQFFPKQPTPKISLTDRIVDTVKTLTALVKNPHVPEPFPKNSGALTVEIDALQKIINSPTRNQSRPTDSAQSQRATENPATQMVKPRRSQRVQQQTINQPQAGTQRVENQIQQQLRRIQEKGKRYALGTSIIKSVNGRLYQGWVIDIDRTRLLQDRVRWRRHRKPYIQRGQKTP